MSQLQTAALLTQSLHRCCLAILSALQWQRSTLPDRRSKHALHACSSRQPNVRPSLHDSVGWQQLLAATGALIASGNIMIFPLVACTAELSPIAPGQPWIQVVAIGASAVHTAQQNGHLQSLADAAAEIACARAESCQSTAQAADVARLHAKPTPAVATGLQVQAMAVVMGAAPAGVCCHGIQCDVHQILGPQHHPTPKGVVVEVCKGLEIDMPGSPCSVPRISLSSRYWFSGRPTTRRQPGRHQRAPRCRPVCVG